MRLEMEEAGKKLVDVDSGFEASETGSELCGEVGESGAEVCGEGGRRRSKDWRKDQRLALEQRLFQVW